MPTAVRADLGENRGGAIPPFPAWLAFALNGPGFIGPSWAVLSDDIFLRCSSCSSRCLWRGVRSPAGAAVAAKLRLLFD